MAKQLNIGNTTSPVDVNITQSLKINGKTAVVSSSESLGESTRPLYLENGELLAGSQQYIFWEEDGSGANPTGSNPYVLKAGDTMTGPLILSGNPSLALAAVPKQYVDKNFLTNTDALNLFYTKEGSDGKFLSLEGGTLTGNLTVNGITTGKKFHSNANSPTEDLAVIPSDNAIALETGNGNGAVSAWIWREQYAPSNWGMYHNNSNDYVYFVGNNIARLSIGLSDGRVMGACWNDYAEYRSADSIEPGRCVVEKGDDTLTLSTERLQPGANIISDTFGFAIGESEESKTPIAVSGRVLAYTWEDREVYRDHIGEFVCSGPQGTVSLMNTEEYHKYPHCAIGTVSSVPDYEEWGTGKVKVNERVWIKIL